MLIMALARLGRGQVDAILKRQGSVDGLPLQPGGNEEAHQIRNHQRDDDGIVARRLKDHHHRGHGSTHDAGEGRAHAD